jgi:outer membrane receptor protein involved in Fe transport
MGARRDRAGRAGRALAAVGRFTWRGDPRPPFVLLVTLAGGRVARPVDVTSLDARAILTVTVEATITEDVIVAAGAAPSIDTTPGAAMTMLSARDVALRGPASLVQSLEAVPGVHQVSEGQSAVPAVRGLARGRTLMLLDGSRVTAERRVGSSASFLDPSVVEGVDVARGPGSVAYGSDAFGGVISVRTKRPSLERPDVGAFDLMRVSGFVGASSQRTDQNRLPTSATPREIARADIAATDFQVRAMAETRLGATSVELGLDLNGRRGLEARDIALRYDLDDMLVDEVATLSIASARRTDTGLFVQASRPVGGETTVTVGLRVDHVRSVNEGGYFGDRSVTHGAAAGFGAVTFRPTARTTLTAQLSRGFRDPTLSDRFYRGPTGRGFITGNPELNPETSIQTASAASSSASNWTPTPSSFAIAAGRGSAASSSRRRPTSGTASGSRRSRRSAAGSRWTTTPRSTTSRRTRRDSRCGGPSRSGSRCSAAPPGTPPTTVPGRARSPHRGTPTSTWAGAGSRPIASRCAVRCATC